MYQAVTGGDAFLFTYDDRDEIDVVEDEFESGWRRMVGGDLGASAHGVAVDTAGNVYFSGTTRHFVDGPDSFITKYNSTGDEAWTSLLSNVMQDWPSLDGAGEWAYDLAADDEGNLFVAGRLTVIRDPGGAGSAGFVLKLDSSGMPVLKDGMEVVDYVEASIHNEVRGVALDRSDEDNINVYIVGNAIGELNGAVAEAAQDLFVSKYDSDLGHIWTKTYGGNAFDQAYDITVDANGDVYVAGLRGGEAFVGKINADGDEVWTQRFGESHLGGNVAYGVSVDAQGNVFAAGTTFSELEPGVIAGGLSDAFLAKILPRLPGDYDENGVVDAADLAAYKAAFGDTVASPFEGADGNGSGVVDGGDFLLWQRWFGKNVPAVASIAVPEAGTLVLLLLGAAIAFSSRKATQ